MHLLRLAAISLLCLAAAGCGPDLDEGSRAYDVDRYALQGSFDWGTQLLKATVSIDLRLTEDDVDAIELDSQVAVADVRVAGAGSVSFEAHPTEGRLVVDVSDAPDVTKGAAITIEIDYEAAAGDALRAVPPRAGDPLPIRALHTDSEPLGASAWMPCNNVPRDRARFSVSMRVPAAEMMIANGVLVEDVADGADAHRVRYETAYPLPPYLMAFAISDFEVKRTDQASVPIAIWHRRGLPGSHDAMLAELARMTGVFEGLLGPYPFERYSLVLLPGFPGGMENAGISFQRETSSSEPELAGDLTLAAHELAHQWFGDLVTVETWDDVWIKEGMAVLLEYEAARPHIDASGKGTLNGDELAPEDGVPIRDRGAPPDLKYTSGPYGRAAWLLTQIRSLMGDDAFFAALRGVLEERRFGSIGTDDFLGAFEPGLGPEATARARRAVDARAMPRLQFFEEGDGAAVRVQIIDPAGALVAPMDIAWVAADGAERSVPLAVDQKTLIEPAPGDLLLVFDPADRHPKWGHFSWDWFTSQLEPIQPRYDFLIAPSRAPKTAEAIARLVELAGAHQSASLIDALNAGVLPPLLPEELDAFTQALDGDAAKALARFVACRAAKDAKEADPAVYGAWVDTLTTALASPPPPFGLAYVVNYGACDAVVAPQDLFEGEWAQMQAGLAPGDISHVRLAYLAKFRMSDEMELATWAGVAEGGPSLLSRKIAAEHLSAVATEDSPPEWRSTFINLLRTSESAEVLQWAIRGLLRTAPSDAPGDAESFAAIRAVLANGVTRSVHTQTFCAAYQLAGYWAFSELPDIPPTYVIDPTWNDFILSLAGLPISPRVLPYLEDPDVCL